MKAVFRHELSSYFTGIIGYVFGAFLLLFAGIYTTVYNLQLAVTNFEYVLSGMSFVFLVIVPILTMKVIAEERKQKTDQLLYSLPISMTKVVLGKYAALLVIFFIPVAIICLYPLILSAFGSVYLPTAYGAITGFFFLGATLIAIGVFISSVTENQAIAAGLCFTVMLLNYFLTDLASYLPTTPFSSFLAFTVVIILIAVLVRLITKNSIVSLASGLVLEGIVFVLYITDSSRFEGLFASVLEGLSLFERFYTFIYGVFDISALIYFVTIIGVFLFLSVQSLEKRRWSE